MVVCSFYEITDSMAACCFSLRKMHLVDWFDGCALDDRWSTTSISGGASTFQMSPCINEGFEQITCGADTNNGGAINMNNVRHYDDCASKLIAVMQVVEQTDTRVQIGYTNTTNFATDFSLIGLRTPVICGNYEFRTGNTCQGSTNTCVAKDANFNTYILELKACTNCATINGGCVDATRSCDLPDVKLQPTMLVTEFAAAAKTGRINYLEVFNT